MAHPHEDCPRCAEQKLDEDKQLEALIPSMRIDAQGTLDSLKRRGFEIRKSE